MLISIKQDIQLKIWQNVIHKMRNTLQKEINYFVNILIDFMCSTFLEQWKNMALIKDKQTFFLYD